MPLPNEPWIALEFGALETYVSLIPEGEEAPISLTFPNVFTFDEENKQGRLYDCESLADVEDDRAFVLKLNEVKHGGNVYVSGCDFALSVESLLRSLFSKIRSECEERYFAGRSISTCYILARNRREPFQALRSAASTAGFARVEYRNKAECVVQAALEEGKRYEKYVVLCDVSYGLCSLTVLSSVGDGYSTFKHEKAERRFYYGFERVAEKVAEPVLKASKKQSTNEKEKAPYDIVLKIVAALQKAPDDDGFYRIRYRSKKYKFSREQIQLCERSCLEKLNKLFKAFFAEIDDLTRGKPYEIVVVGAGSEVPALRKTLRKLTDPSTEITVEGVRNAAFDWAQILLSTEIPPKRATSDRKSFARAFHDAQNSNDGKACLSLAERYFKGDGTLCLREEAFYWTSQAASRGYVKALYRLGKCYEYGLGVEPDPALANETYRQAALKGHPKAQYKLACRYADCGQDEQAQHWLELAIDQGYEKALEKFNEFGYKHKTIAEKIDLSRTKTRKKERRDGIVGAFLSALVFGCGAIYIPTTYTAGEDQQFAATLASLVLTGCALAIVIIGSSLLLKYLNNAR